MMQQVRVILFAFAVGILLAEACPPLTHAQKISDIVKEQPQWVLQLSLDRDIEFRSIQTLQLQSPLGPFADLANPTVRKALELPDSKQQSIEKIVRQAEELRTETLPKLWKRVNDDIVQAFQYSSDLMQSELEDLLGAEGKARLIQLQNQRRLRLMGLPQLVEWLQDQQTIAWELTKAEKATTEEVQKKFREKLSLTIQNLQKQLLESVVPEIPEEAAETVKAMTQQSCRDPISAGLLVVSISDEKEIKTVWIYRPSAFRKQELVDKYTDLLRARTYLVQEDGQLDTARSGGVVIPSSAFSLNNAIEICELLTLGEWQSDLKLSEEQVQSFSNRLEKLLQVEAVSEDFIAKEYPESPLLGMENLLDIHRYATGETAKELESVLTEAQSRKLLEYLELREVSRSGVIPSLLNGLLGDRWKLTDQQKDRMKTKVEAAVKQFEESLVELERDVRQQLIDALDRPHRHELQQVLGDWSDDWPASVIVVMALTR